MPQPNKIPLAFAASGDKNTIPERAETTGLASWREGFPAITSAPFSEGGIAPKRADFNGIFNALSLATLWQQQGGFYAYDNTTDYEVGNVVEYSGDLYKCITANGPSSAVKAPTDTTVWSKVMTAADAAALYLPLSGGTLTGDITTKNIIMSSGVIRTVLDSQVLYQYGGTGWQHGAEITLFGKGHSTNPGDFTVRADNGTNASDLYGRPNGELKWNGENVATIQTGTWTPVLAGGTTPGAFVYGSNTGGQYIKIGSLVYVHGYIELSSFTTYPTGSVIVKGLPYIAARRSMLFNVRGDGSSVNNSFYRFVGASSEYNTSYINLRVNNAHQSATTQGLVSYANWFQGGTDYYAVEYSSGYANITIDGFYVAL